MYYMVYYKVHQTSNGYPTWSKWWTRLAKTKEEALEYFKTVFKDVSDEDIIKIEEFEESQYRDLL